MMNYKTVNRKRYIYLVDIPSLEVERFDLNNKFNHMIIGDKLSKGYLRTRPEIYRRYKANLLTEASFRDVNKIVMGEETITRKANIFYNE